jgi:DNA polymerase-3 subunit delta
VAAELKPAYLIGGTDRPKVTRALERLRARFESDAVERHRAGEISGEDAVAACNAMGLFATAGRLIIVDAVETWKAADVAAITAYLKMPSPDTTLALVGGELKKDSALAKAVAGAGELLIWEVPQKSLPSWVAEQFKLAGAAADIDACRLLIELVGEDLYELASEVDKITTWAQPGATITDHEIEELVAPRAEASGFALTDAWGQRDTAAVLRASEALMERSGDPRSKSIPMVVGQLTNHVARVRACQVFESQGISAKEAATQMKRHPFYVGKLYTQARNFSAEELRSVTVRLSELDFVLKGGSRIANDLELERALIDVTARREPTARNPN